MRIKYHRNFKKSYKKRVFPNKKLVDKFKQRLKLRVDNPAAAILKDHQLVGKLSQYRAFSVTGNVRVVYKIENKTLHLYDVGTHNQVY
jgi:addiction module RelE/StbE family toxin